MRYPISLSIAGLLFLSASSVSANPKKEAAKHFADGLRLYAEKDYDAAATELEISYNLKNDQTTLFAWAQAERLFGNCDESKVLLSKYVANGANAKQSKAAYDLMEQCTPRVVEEPVAADPVVPPVTDPSAGGNANGDLTSGGSVSEAEADDGKHWYKDWVGLTLLASGGVGLTISALSYSAARGKESDAEMMGITYDEFITLRSDAEQSRTTAVIFGVTGGVLLTAGAAYILMDHITGNSSEESAAAEGMVMHFDGNAGGVSFSGSF